jgi:hypothetical protein
MSSIPLIRSSLILLAAAMLPAASTPIYPAHSLILFVASWCAPCRAELRDIDRLIVLAAPATLRVTPIDRTAATAAMLRSVAPARIWRSARAVDDFARQSASLPFSLMTDAEGRACATHRRALDRVAIEDLRRRCSAASAR